MATSLTELCNMALNLINEPEVQTIDNPESKQELILSRFIMDVYEEVLISNEWNFSTTVIKLPKLADTETDFDYANKFALPRVPKVLRVVSVVDRFDLDSEWERRGDFIVSNLDAFACKVILMNDDVRKMPTYLARCIATLLAGRIAIPLLGIEGRDLANYYEQMYLQEVRPNALFLDKQEERSATVEKSSLLGGYVINGDMVYSEGNYINFEGV